MTTQKQQSQTRQDKGNSEPKWKVGQEVIYLETYSKHAVERLVPVARVGKKYVYIKLFSRLNAYHIDTGYQAGSNSGFSRIQTIEGREQEKRATKLRQDLRSWGIALNGRPATERIEEIYEALKPLFDTSNA